MVTCERKYETWSDLEKVIGEFYKQLGISGNPDYNDCYRIGKPSASTNRPILLKLLRLRDKKLIMSKKKNLKGTTIYVNDDNPKDVRKKLSILRSKEREMRDQQPHARVFIRNQVLYVKVVAQQSSTLLMVTIKSQTDQEQAKITAWIIDESASPYNNLFKYSLYSAGTSRD
jgi:hypothetical protein